MLQSHSGWPLRPAALLICLALPAVAQTLEPKLQAPAAASKAVRPDPLDAGAAVPQLRYPPAFAGYKGIDAQPVGSWKEANDLTGKIGGWRSYARQAREGDAAVPAGHGQHKSP